MSDKEIRQVVVAKYSDNFVYKVPKGIDIEDRTQVKQYWIKWNRLHIEMINGEEIIIDTECDLEMKYPDEMRVEYYDEYYDEETESESEEEPTETEKEMNDLNSESDEEFVDEMNTKIDALIEKASYNIAKAELIKELEKEIE